MNNATPAALPEIPTLPAVLRVGKATARALLAQYAHAHGLPCPPLPTLGHQVRVGRLGAVAAMRARPGAAVVLALDP